MAKSFKEMLAESGQELEFQSGGKAPDSLTKRENIWKAHKRIEDLKAIYMDALSSINSEFPYWYTREYFQHDTEIPVVRRAMALKCAFSHLTPLIYPGELMVMRKGAFNRASFPMPWLSEGFYMANESSFYQEALKRGSASVDAHSTMGEGGGNVTKSFGKVISIAGKFGIRQEEVPALLELAKMWEGKSVDDLGNKYEKMVPDYEVKENIMRTVVCMFDSGFTLPQGREVANYYYPLEYGFDGLIKMAREMMDEVAGKADGDGMVGMNRLYNYQAVILAIEGVQKWINNYGVHATWLAEREKDAKQKAEYLEIAERLFWIEKNPPRTFRDAFQFIETIHLAIVNEDAISGLSPGRIGQVLYPWFEQDIEAGRITEDEVLELCEQDRLIKTSIDCFASVGVVGGVLSGNTFNTTGVGGVDRHGKTAVNRLEYLIVKAGGTNAMPQPNISLQYDETIPADFLALAADVIKTGCGYPAFMNNDIAEQFILQHYGHEGMTVEESRAWAIGGCLETSPSCWKPLHLNGKEYWIPGGAGQPTSVGVHFIAMPKILELVIFNGVDKRTGIKVFEPHNKKLDTYEELFEQFKAYWAKAVDILALTNNIQHDVWRKNNMAIFHSMTKPDCLASGHLINELGYRYNATFNVESAGNITCVNSLTAMKKLVYDDKKYSLEEFKDAMLNNFGFKTAHEIGKFSLMDQESSDTATKDYKNIHFDCLNAPKYGNDDPYADKILLDWEDWFCAHSETVESLYAEPMYSCQISVSTHGAMGSATLASADGRLQGTTFADASLSAYPGTDKNGPFALMNSATIWDHSKSQNSQLNIKIHPSAIKGAEGSKKLIELVKGYMRKGGFHVQFNVVDSKVLKDAQAHPKNYRDLMVRVAGFTQYWCEIGKQVQDELIARTEYESV